MIQKQIKIATYHQRRQREYYPPQEFAGSVEVVSVPEGNYDVFACRDQWGNLYFMVELQGMVTFRAWYGTNVRESYPNIHTTYCKQFYGYELARLLYHSIVQHEDGPDVDNYVAETGISGDFDGSFYSMVVNGNKGIQFSDFEAWKE